MEASQLEKQRPSSLVTRAALQDAMLVLDENRALKQKISQFDGLLETKDQVPL